MTEFFYNLPLSIEITRTLTLQFYINVNKNSIFFPWNQGRWKMSDADDIGIGALWGEILMMTEVN